MSGKRATKRLSNIFCFSTFDRKTSAAMRAGNQSKRPHDNLSDVSKDAVGRLVKRVKSRSAPDHPKAAGTYLVKSDSPGIQESGLETKNECSLQNTLKTNDKSFSGYEVKSIPADSDQSFELEESEWEDGSIRTLDSITSEEAREINGITVEFDISPDSGKRKTIRRATAEEKDVAELVHKVNMLCLLGRGRLVDQACNDPLIKACLWSLLPSHLQKIAEVPALTANTLTPLVNWFHHRFRVKDTGSAERTPSFALAHVLEAQEGTAEEVAALSVALFRALNLTTRFVAVLDVTSLKPEVDKPEASSLSKSKSGSGIFNSSTLMVTRSRLSPSISPSTKMEGPGQTSVPCEKKVKSRKSLKAVIDASSMDHSKMSHPSTSEACGSSDAGQPKGKRDLEFERQLNMALSATAIENSRSTSSNSSPSSKKFEVARRKESSVSASGVSTAIGSKKVGAPLYWAEVYCSGENLTGKWIHIDAVNAIIDGEQRVEAGAAACKKPLKYVVAFAGHGAKDVTRRYCTQWYKVASQRVNSMWWDAVLAPLKELESQATDKLIHMEPETLSMKEKVEAQDNARRNEKSNSSIAKKHIGGLINPFAGSSSSLEDMELETRSLTEPLPTNQQAYKNHQLYAIERWLGKYQVLHPKGPVLGFCSGHPVYPRTCVQTLLTRRRWLREGCQVKADELPVKIMKRSPKQNKVEAGEDDDPAEGDDQVSLFGKWQTEPLCLPHAVDGIVPKNERGQVDVWSEKCLPPGTIHLRLPRVWMIAKRLGIDYAPAMVGFEFRNGRSIPVFDGIVVCTEFKDAIKEVYCEEEERREAEERKKNEAQALSRWYQLLSSIVTRQRLKNVYGDNAPPDGSKAGGDVEKCPEENKLGATTGVIATEEEHEHVYMVDDETFDEETGTRTKRCRCGFSIEFEQM